MKIGECVLCSATIIKFTKNGSAKVLGSYRSIVAYLEDGGSFEVPLCIDCHDSFGSHRFGDLAEKFYAYMKDVSPNNAKNYEVLTFCGFLKKGSLKAQDIKGGAKVWR